jgi:hypothetical protein
MSVNKIVYLNETATDLEELDVEGTTFAPKGAITQWQGRPGTLPEVLYRSPDVRSRRASAMMPLGL